MRSFAIGYERVCRVILIVFVINCAMVVHTCMGAVAAGFFPAVGAAFATYRTWMLDEDFSWTVRRTWCTFHAAWKQDVAAANRFGWAQAAVGALLAWDYYLANWNLLGGVVGVGVSGLLLVVNVGYLVWALVSWAVRAHVDAPLGTLLRLSAVTVVGRPRCTVSLVALLAVVVWVWTRWPGVLVALGASMTVGVVAAAVYSFAALPGMQVRSLRYTASRLG
ncbi:MULTISPECIES: YesL family protein [Actinomyces]|uniref:YesL family protein n=1 Tax=Actinomyces respiraculi TaxID=2744574 RepID=A0A7T0LJ95_9ACTO|nr:MULTISPECIES: YesL family protein [Actinomyces]QPL04635.1 YesL family protein [Actinomyces respiraculi]